MGGLSASMLGMIELGAIIVFVAAIVLSVRFQRRKQKRAEAAQRADDAQPTGASDRLSE